MSVETKGTFRRQLAQLASSPANRKWQFVLYDQLNPKIGLLADYPPQEVGLIFVESPWKPSLRPYHKHKLALLLSSQRHYAIEQAERGVAIRYLSGADTPAVLLEKALDGQPVFMVQPAEREMREHLSPLSEAGLLVELPHSGWLTTRDDFRRAFHKKRGWRMDSFYRFTRRKYGILMGNDGKPVGGKWSFDADNRQTWNGSPSAPEIPTFTIDAITAEVAHFVADRYAHHPGSIQPDRIPASIEQVSSYWQWVKEHCLEYFGPFEDAMHHRERQLFHSRMSGLLNLHRIMPRVVLDDVQAADIPLNSKEGFIRQLVGWREYVRHVHNETDGFRTLPEHATKQDLTSGPNLLNVKEPLPDVYWGEKSGLFCLDHAVREVIEDAHSHHINRLMVLANWASLLDVSPRELTDWFWAMFEDAYEWVVEPNVFGMGSFALGELMMTKPYISGSAYVDRMSNYCQQCAFNPKTTCPMTPLYWRYLAAHRDHFDKNPRMSLVLGSLRRRSPEKMQADAAILAAMQQMLREGKSVTPGGLTAQLEMKL